MKHIIALLISASFGTAANAECFVEYKAKQDDPLTLHYGWMKFDTPCPADLKQQTEDRLTIAGWSLLSVVSTSANEPDAKSKEDAGEFFLRY